MKDTLYILFHYLKTKHIKFSSRDQLERWQEKRIQKHLQWVKENATFYRDYFEGKEVSEWREFPVIDKQIMMDNFDQLNTVGITKQEGFEIALQSEESRDFSPAIRDITIGLSSGTSGNRGLFLVSEKERLLWSSNILAKVLPHHILSSKKSRIAFFLRANSKLYSTVEKGKITFRFYDLIDSIEEHIKSLHTYHPTILVAPPSMLRKLAEEKKLGRLNLQPEKVISVAEVLDPIDQQFIEREFGQMVHQVYQCTEGFLATTCSHGTLHLNEDIVAIQKRYLNKEEGKFSPIITDFSRKSQPIIRYELNDILTEKKDPCPCGSPFIAIEKIEGRCDDIFYFQSKDSQQLQTIFPDFIRRIVMQSSNHIREYQVIQHAIHLVEIQIIWEGSQAEEELNNTFLEFCEKMQVRMPKLVYKEYETREATQKLRRVERRAFPLSHDQTI